MIRSNSLVLSPGFARPFARSLTPSGMGGGGVSIVNNGVLAPFVTFARASEGTYTGSDSLLKTAAVNEPRIDYDPVTGELRGLLIEEQRTNLLPRSQEFDNSTAWGLTNITVTPNGAIAPDGTLTADILTVTTTAAANAHNTVGITATAPSMVYSIYTKKGTRTTATFLLRNNTTATNFDIGVFDYDTGTITGTGWAAQYVGNGWYRLTYARTTGITVGDQLRCYIGAAGFVLNAGDSWLVWGAQLEAGSFATSYIPTAGTAVTRAADVAIVSSLSAIDYNAAEGAFYVEGTNAAGNTSVAVSNNTVNEFMALRRISADRAEFHVRSSNVIQASIATTGGAAPNGAAFKMASAYKANDFASAYNGALTGTDAAGAVPTVNAMQIGHLNAGSPTNFLNSHIRRLRYYPRRLSDAQLQALTA